MYFIFNVLIWLFYELIMFINFVFMKKREYKFIDNGIMLLRLFVN